MSALPTFVAAGAIASGTGTISPGLPANIHTGDILIMALETSNQAISASGWAEATNSPISEATDATRLTILWCRYDENNIVGTTTSDSGDHQIGRIIAVRGCIATGDPFDITASGTDTTSDTSGSIPGAVTTVANTLVVAIASAGNDPAANGTANFASWTNANLASFTERVDNVRTDGNGGGIGIATGGWASTGDYGASAVTYAVATRKALWSGALKPATTVTGISDNFNDNSKDATIWGGYQDTGVVVSETSGLVQVAITAAGGGVYGVYQAKGYYDMTGAAVIVQVITAASQSLESDCFLQLDRDNSNRLWMHIQQGTLYATKTVADVDTNLNDIPYVAGTHKWLRIREAGGTTFFDYSTDGKKWTNHASAANPLAMTSMCPKFGYGIFGVSGTGTAQFDNFNCYLPYTESLLIGQAVNRAAVF